MSLLFPPIPPEVVVEIANGYDSMKIGLLIAGVLLVILGVLAFAGVGFTTNRARVAVGPLEATVKEERSLPPVVAGGAIVLGVVLLVAAGRRSR